jgi:CHRD domain
MTMKRTVLGAAVVLSLLWSTKAPARGNDDDDHDLRRNVFAARLEGENETPAVSTVGHGSALLRVDEAASTLTFRLSYADLEGTVVTAAHVHLGQRNVAGGVMFFFCGGGGKPACPASPATITGTVTAADIVGPTGQGIAPAEFAEVARALREEIAYANVHTDKQPAGEIRGQLH